MQKWEYCILTGLEIDQPGEKDEYRWQLRKLQVRGPALVSDVQEGDEMVFYNIVARLGEEGWQMVYVTDPVETRAKGRPAEIQAAWFKRPVAT